MPFNHCDGNSSHLEIVRRFSQYYGNAHLEILLLQGVMRLLSPSHIIALNSTTFSIQDLCETISILRYYILSGATSIWQEHRKPQKTMLVRQNQIVLEIGIHQNLIIYGLLSLDYERR